jgi:hypothetical protein
MDAGSKDIELAIDKKQRTSIVWLALLLMPIKLFSRLSLSREKNKKNR